MPFYFIHFHHQLCSERPRPPFYPLRPNCQYFARGKKHSNKFLRHEWWRWLPRQCVTLKQATSMASYKTAGTSWDAFEWVICSSDRECILFIGSKLCLQPMVTFFTTTHWQPRFLSPKVPASCSHVSYSTWRWWPPRSSGEFLSGVEFP